MKFKDLQSWLSWQETLHFSEIELGLERIQQVANQLAIDSHWQCPVITVAGTNGKGSSVAFLESIYHQAGYRVGSYTSPHLLAYNERIKINTLAVDDEQICHAFEQVEQARMAADEISLTYFEFGTLAALLILKDEKPDVVVLEVGLGGRLDAVNIIDADIALITPVALDHQGWLGETREAIASEKAGIIKPFSTVVCSDPDPAKAIRDKVQELAVKACYLNEDFRLERAGDAYRFLSSEVEIDTLPAPALAGEFQLGNAAAVIMTCQLLADRLPLNTSSIADGLQQVKLVGRFQQLDSSPDIYVDVAHNPHAVAALAQNLARASCKGRTFAVLAMLEDKAICESVRLIAAQIDHFYLAGLSGSRALSVNELYERVQDCVTNDKLSSENSVAEALSSALSAADDNDRIIVFGSFLTVSAAIEHINKQV